MLGAPARTSGVLPDSPHSSHMRKLFPRGPLAVALTALGLAASALGDEPAGAAPAAANSTLQPETPVPRARENARSRLRDRLGRTGVVATDRRTGGVRVAARLNGFLTGARQGSAARIALGYVKAQRDAFGLSDADLATLELAETTRSNGITHLRWVQRVDGVPYIDGDLRAAVTADGRLLHVTGGARPGLAQADTTPKVTRAEAIRAVRGDSASLVLSSAGLAWRVIRGTEDILVDARTKAIVRRTDRLSDVVGTAYRHYPGARHGGAPEPVQLDAWLREPDLGAGTQAAVSADLDGDGELDPGEQIARKPDGSFEHARFAWPGPFCPAAGCSWDPLRAFSYEVNKDHFGTQLFVSVHRFADHLAKPPIGFAGFESGRIDARVLVGADGRDGGIPVNNASMYTPPAPQSPQMRMYLFKDTGQGYISGHASDDASIVHHEHAHGLLARTVTDAQGWGALNLRQSKALDEGLADVYALDYLAGEGLVEDTPVPGEVRMAPFLDPKGKARTQPIDCPVGATAAPCRGGYTYGDLGRVHPNGAEEHADGEVIAQALWDLRTALADTQRFRLLLTEGLRMVPAEPTFLDLRNAILLADTATGGGSRATIWAAFAQRGMGFYAATQDGNDIDPAESFELPPAGGAGTLRGVVRDRDSGELLPGARVRLAGHETSDGAIAGLRATTDEHGEYALTGVPAGTYPGLTVARDGYETAVRDDVVVSGVADVTLRKNWAHLGWGTQVFEADGPDHTAEGCGPRAAFDGEALTGWAVDTAPQRSVTIWLPEEVRLTSVAIVPRPGCGLGAEALPAQITVESSGARGLLWDEIGTLWPTAKGMHDPAELRPVAPLDGVRQLRVTLHARDQAGPYLGLGDVRVFATTKIAPRASFTWSPRTPGVGDTVALDARDSTPGSHPVTGYRWDFDGDGRYETPWSPSPDATDTFDAPGRRTVALQIRDEAGETDTVRHTFWVGRDAEISDLGALDGDSASRAIFPTTRGEIAGQSYVAGNANRQAARYRGGRWERLEPLHAGGHSGAYQGNDAGQTVGFSAPSATGDERAVLWNGTTPTDLGTLGGRRSQALSINASGTVVGFAHNAANEPRAFIKRPGGPLEDIQELAGIPEDERTPSIATKITDDGTVVGCLRFVDYACAGNAAFTYKDGVLTRLPSLDGVGNAAALHATDTGSVVGWSAALGGTHAVQWIVGVPFDLGTLGGPNSSALAVNGSTIVGSAEDGLGRSRAVRWEGEGPQDLNDLVQDTGWELLEAEGINARGEVTGTGVIDGERHGFMLNLGPCRVCIENVRFQERDVPSARWVDTGADGTVDGNLVRITATVRNDDDQPHIFQVRFADQDADAELPGSGETVTLNPGQSRDVQLEWDTDGLAWDAGTPLPSRVVRVQAKLGRTVFDTHRAALDIRPRPLVLVHGMLADAATWSEYGGFAERAHPNWEAFAVGDGRAPGRMRTGDWFALSERPYSIASNARILAEYVQGVRDQEDAEHVDLVAHSMGGLISRKYIQDHMPEAPDAARPVVRHLIQLGTPNMGSPCADTITTWQTVELRTDAMANFNRLVTDRRGVPFSIFAGDPSLTTCSSPEVGDSVVPLSSALWEIDDAEVDGLLHTSMTGSGAVFSSFVRPRLDGRGVRAAAKRTRAAADERVAGRSRTFLARQDVTVPAGGHVDVPVDVDVVGTLRAHVFAGPHVAAELRGPDGGTAATEDRGLFRTVSASDSEPGRWVVRLRSTAERPSVAGVAVTLDGDPWHVDVAVGDRAGGRVALVAAVGRGRQRLTSATVQATFTDAGGEQRTVRLADDGAHGDGAAGDGCFGAVATVPAGAQMLSLAARAQGAGRVHETWVDVRDGDAGVTCPPQYGPGEIAYLSGIEPVHGEVVDDDGRQAPFWDFPQQVGRFSFSPDGEWVAYDVNDGTQLFVAPVDGDEEPTPLAESEWGDRQSPVFSPDGKRLAYSKDCGFDYPYGNDDCRLAVMDIATRAERVVPLAGAAEPTWSPDGTQLAFRRWADESDATEIWVVRLDGTGLRRVTTGLETAREPAWSPDGQWIAFTRTDGETDSVFVIRPDGGELRRVAEAASEPTWSPDSQRLAFVSERDGRWVREIYTARPDGSGLRRLTRDGGYKQHPAWRARSWSLEPVPPKCTDTQVTTRRDTPVRIVLPCTDANGDALKLSVVANPAHGTVSAVDATGAVRYAPAPGFTGTDAFTVQASDGAATARARITVIVKEPPAPEPPATGPVPPGLGVSAPGTGGGGSSSSPKPGGGGAKLPATCATDPRTGRCIVEVGCPLGGSNCTGRFSEVAGGRKASMAAATRYLKPVKVTIKAGKTRKVALRLTAAGRKALKRKRKLVVRVRAEVRQGGKVVQRTTKKVTFKQRRR